MSDQPTTSLGHLPAGEKWEFDATVTHVFDDMIARSIPDYGTMRNVVDNFATLHGAPNGVVLDLGCSTGLSIRTFAAKAKRVVGVEISESMLDEVRERFVSYHNVEILELDLRKSFPYIKEVDVTLAIFTLQFIPVEHRRRVVGDVFTALKRGGAFLIAEKVIGESAQRQAAFAAIYHRFKEAQGYTTEEIDRKALALEGRLVPNTAAENEHMLRAAGFRDVECIWRTINFGLWIGIK